MSTTLFPPAANPLPKMPPPQRRSFQIKASSAQAFTEAKPRLGATAASLYDVLRVTANASQSEIKSAYRGLAKEYHPDASGSESDGRDFIQIHNAYATLSDPAARAVYDMSLGAAHIDFNRQRRSVGFRADGFYSTRRWETDQCW
ncbi:chaperone protein dnaJ 11, chloroplastic [Pyrus x bretschneideri]|uniref:chaperone protein dnaJ 11, chloroplastic n=1 Tax=Pyrus x bretschneideri TaxID=225117 RepID=UPI00202EEAC9|nr:chaperone protein dnaJ 11, chloroplastic [Pyrus x bretschneideri]